MSGPLKRVPVFTDLSGYRAAVASLPVSTVPADAAAGAVVVVSGGGAWWEGVLAAQAGGAAGVVVANPLASPPAEIGEQLGAAPVPVLLERPRLRPDMVQQLLEALADAAPGLVAVECLAVTSEAAAVVRDALGWAGAIGRGGLELRSATTTPHGSIGLLQGGGAGRPLDTTLLVNIVSSGRPGGFIRLTCLGEVLATVTVDGPAGVAGVELATGRGTLRLPPCFEAPERLALRRAVQAVGDGQSPPDLAGLLHDSRLAASFLPSAPEPAGPVMAQRTIGTFFG